MFVMGILARQSTDMEGKGHGPTTDNEHMASVRDSRGWGQTLPLATETSLGHCVKMLPEMGCQPEQKLHLVLTSKEVVPVSEGLGTRGRNLLAAVDGGACVQNQVPCLALAWH